MATRIGYTPEHSNGFPNQGTGEVVPEARHRKSDVSKFDKVVDAVDFLRRIVPLYPSSYDGANAELEARERQDSLENGIYLVRGVHGDEVAGAAVSAYFQQDFGNELQEVK